MGGAASRVKLQWNRGAVHTIHPNGISLELELISFKLVDSNLNLAPPPTNLIAEKQLTIITYPDPNT